VCQSSCPSLKSCNAFSNIQLHFHTQFRHFVPFCSCFPEREMKPHVHSMTNKENITYTQSSYG